MPGQYRSEKSADSGSSPDRREFSKLDDGGKPTPESIRILRREVASTVTVVTTADRGGFKGVTVSAFAIVSLLPPRLLVCLGAESERRGQIESLGHFAVSVLGDTQEFLADQFAGRAPSVNPRFDGVKHRLSGLGDPILEDSIVWFSCAVAGTSAQGDHIVIYGDIREAGFGRGREPLLYFDGSYRRFEAH